MATTINVFLADLPKSIDAPDDVRSGLQSYFDQTVAKHKLDIAVKVSWAATKPSIGGKDLLCYFVRDSGDTVLGGGGMVGAASTGTDGWTVIGSSKLTGSEVYLTRLKSKPAMIPKLALHELMHNMSRTGDTMHKPGMSIGADPVDEKATLSTKDMEYIAAHLGKTDRTQWDGGWTRYTDPLRGVL